MSQNQTKTIIIRNPSPELIKFLDAWKKRQQEIITRITEKYRKILE